MNFRRVAPNLFLSRETRLNSIFKFYPLKEALFHQPVTNIHFLSQPKKIVSVLKITQNNNDQGKFPATQLAIKSIKPPRNSFYY